MKEEYLFNDLSKAIPNYPSPQMALIPFLKIINDRSKSIEAEDITMLSRLCEVKAENIIKIIDYYPYFDNSNSSTSAVCVGLPCYLKGANKIAEEPAKYIEEEAAATADSVELINCLGDCHEAPVVQLANGTKCSVVI